MNFLNKDIISVIAKFCTLDTLIRLSQTCKKYRVYSPTSERIISFIHLTRLRILDNTVLNYFDDCIMDDISKLNEFIPYASDANLAGIIITCYKTTKKMDVNFKKEWLCNKVIDTFTSLSDLYDYINWIYSYDRVVPVLHDIFHLIQHMNKILLKDNTCDTLYVYRDILELISDYLSVSISDNQEFINLMTEVDELIVNCEVSKEYMNIIHEIWEILWSKFIIDEPVPVDWMYSDALLKFIFSKYIKLNE